MNKKSLIASSFRDPDGFLFVHKNKIYRQINRQYRADYDLLTGSKLYQKLVEEKLLIPHQETHQAAFDGNRAYKVIKPELIPFISYPYEWSFSQYKDAALTTLRVQKTAFQYGMSLKDASAYNIQFKDGRPVFIDTLSFEKYHEGRPWIAYRQFCQHFLAPLALMSRKDIRLGCLMKTYLDGLPLDLASALLPRSTKLGFSLPFHIHLHAKSQKAFAEKSIKPKTFTVSRPAFQGIIESLESAVAKLTWKAKNTEWADYYDKTNYSEKALNSKKRLVSTFLEKIKPRLVWDMGANTGIFSRLASDRQILTVSTDIDPAAVERNYLACRENHEQFLLPLLMDLNNPSPDIGWGNRERNSFLSRGPVDALMALALIHHLAISNNLPFAMIASLFSEICAWLIIEYIPKDDSQIRRLLLSREDIFTDYSRDSFEKTFSQYFQLKDRKPIPESKRILYLMKSKATKK